jgi:hypothetical protein
LRFDRCLAGVRFFLESAIVSTHRCRYASQYCGGDLPTRLMTRG